MEFVLIQSPQNPYLFKFLGLNGKRTLRGAKTIAQLAKVKGIATAIVVTRANRAVRVSFSDSEIVYWPHTVVNLGGKNADLES